MTVRATSEAGDCGSCGGVGELAPAGVSLCRCILSPGCSAFSIFAFVAGGSVELAPADGSICGGSAGSIGGAIGCSTFAFFAGPVMSSDCVLLGSDFFELSLSPDTGFVSGVSGVAWLCPGCRHPRARCEGVLGDGTMAAVGGAPGHPRARDLKNHEHIHNENIKTCTLKHQNIHIENIKIITLAINIHIKTSMSRTQS